MAVAKPFIVGLTGGIGSGKTAVSNRLGELGAAIVDTDLIAHELTGAGGAAMPAIARQFGQRFVAPDGSLDRAAMRELVFADTAQRERLQSILHPAIADRARRLSLERADGAPYVVQVIPLLAESRDARSRVDRVLVVDCPPELQRQRVIARSGLSAELADAMIAAQASRAQRLAIADDIIDNSGSREQLSAQVDALHRRYVELARSLSSQLS